jgi:glutaredoxin
MNARTDLPIEIYTTPTCPDCLALKRWLATKNLPFIEHDLRDPSVAEEARARTGLRIAPITVIGDKVFYGTFTDQRPGLESVLGLAAGV